jgi:hypothetical protein
MPIGVKSQDFTCADGLRNVTITRMDGKPVDTDAWAAELKVPQIDMERIGPVTWEDESVPGMMHALFTWWTRTPAFRMNPPNPPSQRGEESGGANG